MAEPGARWKTGLGGIQGRFHAIGGADLARGRQRPWAARERALGPRQGVLGRAGRRAGSEPRARKGSFWTSGSPPSCADRRAHGRVVAPRRVVAFHARRDPIPRLFPRASKLLSKWSGPSLVIRRLPTSALCLRGARAARVTSGAHIHAHARLPGAGAGGWGSTSGQWLTSEVQSSQSTANCPSARGATSGRAVHATASNNVSVCRPTCCESCSRFISVCSALSHTHKT